MTDRVPPHDLDVERALLGALLIDSSRIGETATAVAETDFYRPAHSAVFSAIVDEWKSGGRPDVTLVARRLGADREQQVDLMSMLSGAPAPSQTGRYAREVAGLAARRQLIRAGSEIAELGWSEPDPGEALTEAERALQRVTLPAGSVTVDVPLIDDFLDVEDDPLEWLLPRFFARGERAIVVAAEGGSKSMWLRSVAVGAAQGLCPFTLERIPPIRTLIVDLENPGRILRKTLQPMVDHVQRFRTSVYDPSRMAIWQEPGGVDIRTRTGFAQLEAAIAKHHPDLVCMGPLYKAFRKGRGETDEDAATDATARLDDLRTRFDFGLWLEHHAPHSSGGIKRDLRPFGSAVWMRWPEFGISLDRETPDDRTRLTWGHWRGARDLRPWPSVISWGRSGWPWECEWESGMPDVGAA